MEFEKARLYYCLNYAYCSFLGIAVTLWVLYRGMPLPSSIWLILIALSVGRGVDLVSVIITINSDELVKETAPRFCATPSIKRLAVITLVQVIILNLLCAVLWSFFKRASTAIGLFILVSGCAIGASNNWARLSVSIAHYIIAIKGIPKKVRDRFNYYFNPPLFTDNIYFGRDLHAPTSSPETSLPTIPDDLRASWEESLRNRNAEKTMDILSEIVKREQNSQIVSLSRNFSWMHPLTGTLTGFVIGSIMLLPIGFRRPVPYLLGRMISGLVLQ